jgi:hypothetical protein
MKQLNLSFEVEIETIFKTLPELVRIINNLTLVKLLPPFQ